MTPRRLATLHGLVHLLKTGPLPWLLAVSLGGFGAMVLLAALPGAPAICAAGRRAAGALPLASSDARPLAMIAAWLAMLIAMMPPLLAQPVAHVSSSVFDEVRGAALAAFGLAYAAVWMGAGAVLLPLALWLQGLEAHAWVGVGVLLLALAWSGSPAAAAARNRCHRTRPIRPFGRLIAIDGFAYGLDVGLPCVAACWAWMLLPIVVEGAHLTVMGLVMLLLFLERLAPASRPAWQLPPALRMAAAFV